MSDTMFHFQKLTPVNNAKIDVYEEAVNFALEEDDIKNIAITGSYGSGKSSVFATYKSKHPEHRFLHISLAHFHTQGGNKEMVTETVLEGKILNQLIHQIPSDKIDQTNFKLKKEFSRRHGFALTACISAFLLGLLYLLAYSKLKTFYAELPQGGLKTVFSAVASPYTAALLGFICAALLIFFIFELVKQQTTKNILHKISLNGNEIEIFQEDEDSYFDKYLDEIIYLFNSSEADAVIFEDMDRYDINNIFERLREVNFLVNQKRENEKKPRRPMKFFYLLRDDVFVTKDRTKFFDFIIPIVPVMDGSNSYDQFLKYFREEGLVEHFDKKFLQSLSLYIDDMRILKNICNEFMIYTRRIDTTELDWNKMLSMVTYKNMFPRDFSDLQCSRGFVYTLFSEKEALKYHDLKKVNTAERALQLDLQKLKDEYAEQAESRVEYQALTKKLQRISEKKEQLKKAPLPKTLKECLTPENTDEIFNALQSDRFGAVETFQNMKTNPYIDLLKYLIGNGYIDETYADYMTYFYPHSMSNNDKIFLRRVVEGRCSEYGYELNNIPAILETEIMDEDAFWKKEILNFDLFQFLLLENDRGENSSLSVMLRQLKVSENVDFLIQYYDRISDKLNLRDKFVRAVNTEWSEYFFYLTNQSDSMLMEVGKKTVKHLLYNDQIYSSLLKDDQRIKEYAADTLCFCTSETIDSINKDDFFRNYISSREDFLTIPDAVKKAKIKKAYILQLGQALVRFDVRFSKPNPDESDKDLLHFVYENSLYALTFRNIALMLETEYSVSDAEAISSRNFTLIQSRADSPLAQYVSQNMDTYVQEITENCDGSIEDDEACAVLLLNDSTVQPQTKEAYASALLTVLHELSALTDKTVWALAVRQHIIWYSFRNILLYFREFGLDEVLLAFLNEGEESLDFSEGELSKTKDAFFDAVSVCNEVKTEKYEELLVGLGNTLPKLEAQNLDADKLRILIEKDILEMTEENLTQIRSHYKKYLDDFISRHFEAYTSIQSDAVTDPKEIQTILDWDLSDNDKIKLLENTRETFSIVDKGYSDAVNACIAAHHLAAEDKKTLYRDYSSYGEKTKMILKEVILKDIDEILAYGMELDSVLLSELLGKEEVSREDKLALFIKNIPFLEEETCLHALELLGLEDLTRVFTPNCNRYSYQNTAETKRILEAFREKGWIKEFHPTENGTDKFRVKK